MEERWRPFRAFPRARQLPRAEAGTSPEESREVLPLAEEGALEDPPLFRSAEAAASNGVLIAALKSHREAGAAISLFTDAAALDAPRFCAGWDVAGGSALAAGATMAGDFVGRHDSIAKAEAVPQLGDLTQGPWIVAGSGEPAWACGALVTAESESTVHVGAHRLGGGTDGTLSAIPRIHQAGRARASDPGAGWLAIRPCRLCDRRGSDTILRSWREQ